jgi:hypothetical protein
LQLNNNQQNINLNNGQIPNNIINNNTRLNEQRMHIRSFEYFINYTLDSMNDILTHVDINEEKKMATGLYINNNQLLNPEELMEEHKVPSYRDVIFIYILNNYYKNNEASNEEGYGSIIIPDGIHNALNFMSICCIRNITEQQYRELAYSIFNSRYEFQQLENPQELMRIYSLHGRFTYRDVVFLYARHISLDRLLQFV